MRSLGPRDLGRALLGHEEPLLAFAASPGTFRLGCLFVLSAGLAREYDGVYLLPEFWHALLPLAASLVTGTLFWALFFWPWRGGAPSWRSFQGVFWLSAPLAWLYAIPYERFLAPLDAFYANLATLGFVSLWRVLWITRVLAVWRRLWFGWTLMGVLLIADGIVLVLGVLSPRPLFEVMGGVRGSALEHAIGNANTGILWGAVLALPLLALVALLSGAFKPAPSNPLLEAAAARGIERLPVLALSAFAIAAAFTQGEQANRWHVERDLVQGRIADALGRMSALEPGDFPPAWDPPPHLHLRQSEPSIESVLTYLRRSPTEPWVLQRFLPKLFHARASDGLPPPRRVLEARLAVLAAEEGEEEARHLLELLVRHGAALEPDQRRAVEKVHAEVLAGAALLPPAEDDPVTPSGE